MDARWVYMTAKDEEQAKAIGRALVESRLAACVNVLPAMTSMYWWNGAVQEDREAVLVAKTRAELVDPLVAKVKSLHTYTVPCVVALPILAGNPDYLRWLAGETRSP